MLTARDEAGATDTSVARRDIILLLGAIIIGGAWGAGVDVFPGSWRVELAAGGGMRVFGWCVVAVLSLGLAALVAALIDWPRQHGRWGQRPKVVSA